MALFGFCLLGVGFGEEGLCIHLLRWNEQHQLEGWKNNATWGTICNLAQYDCLKFTVAKTLWTDRTPPNEIHTIQQTKNFSNVLVGAVFVPGPPQ